MSDIAKLGLNATRILTENLNDEYEAARTSFFVFTVPTSELSNLIRPATKNVDSPASTDYFDDMNAELSDIISLSVVSSSVPSFEIGTNDIKRGNDTIKSAGLPTFNATTIKLDDFVGLNIKEIMYAWLYKAYNPHTKKGGRMKDYKKTCYLTEYTQDYVAIRRWKMSGCFVTKVDEGEFDRENDGKRQLTVSLSIDWAVLDEGFNEAIYQG